MLYLDSRNVGDFWSGYEYNREKYTKFIKYDYGLNKNSANNYVTYRFQYQQTNHLNNIMSFFGVQINSQINRLILEIRLKLCQNKHSPNFRTIYRSLAAHDEKATGLISPTLFEKALNENGLFFKKFQIQAFEKAFLNQVGMINWFAFLHHLKEPMGPFRREAIEQIFDEIAQGKSQVTVAQLKQKFNSEGCDQFQKVIKNDKTVFEKYIALFATKDDKISREEFVTFYDDLNINFPNDDAFVRYACNQWNSKPRKQQTVTEQQLKSVIKALRFKLIQKTQGTKDQFLLRKLFNEFDRNKNQSIGAYEFDLMLKKLELPTAAKLITPLLDHLDKNKSGYIEYDEFKKFVFFDPFPK